MYVLHLITHAERRGAEVHAVELRDALAELGIEGEVHALARGLGHLDLPVLGPATLHPRTLLQIRRLAREADVVVAHGSRTLPATALALLGTATPTVYRSIGDPVAWSPTRLQAMRVRWALRRMTRVVALWEEAAATLRERNRLAPERVVVIPNAVREWPTSTVPLPDEPSLLFVGSMTEEKRPQLALDAAAAAGVPIRLVGDGPLLPALRRRAAARGQDATFLGSVDKAQVINEYDHCSLLLLTSRTEGQPAVIAEAAQRGRATVALSVGGVASMVTDSRSGVLLPEQIVSPTALADAVSQSLPIATDLGSGATQDTGRRTTFETTAEAWRSLLQSLASRHPQPSEGRP